MNFKHLHYFWVAAKAGGIVKAGAQLHTTPQTLSGQIKLLEDRLGLRLFRKAGRQLELTDEGRVALRYADEIFTLGSELQAALRQHGAGTKAAVQEFRVGVEDAVAKTVVYRLLQPALDLQPALRLVCTEGRFDDLMAQLALNRMDLVLADEPLTKKLNVKAYNHALGSSAMGFFAAPALKRLLKGRFPDCLNGAPMLVPGPNASIRAPLEAWLTRLQLRPQTVAECDDSALMQAFGREGRGVFMAPMVVEAETRAQHGVKLIGHSDELVNDFYAISIERRISHPGVAAISQAARDALFSTASASPGVRPVQA